jgi:predicted amidohydrolase YtcJ
LLTPGKPADLIIDRDLTRIPSESIGDAMLEYTIVGGPIVHARNAASR